MVEKKMNKKDKLKQAKLKRRKLRKQKGITKESIMQTQVKWYKNKAIVKGIITVLALALSAFGYSMSEESQEQLLNSSQEIITVIEQVDESNN